MGYLPNSDDPRSITNWVTLEKNNYRVNTDQPTVVKGKLSVPKKAKGTYLISMIVEEDKSKKDSSTVALNVRYAVILAVHVSGKRKPRYKVQSDDIEVIVSKDRMYLQTSLLNQSEYEFQVKSTAQIRNNKGKLLEKVSLKSQSAWERRDDASRIFPAGNVVLFGEIKNIFSPDEYSVMIRNKLGHQNLPLMRKNIVITEEMIAATKKVSESGVLMVSPSPISIDIRQNLESFTYFEMINNTNDALNITFPNMKNIPPKSTVTSYAFYPPKFLIKPHLSKRVLLRQKHKADTPNEKINYSAKYHSLTSKENILDIAIETIVKSDNQEDAENE